MSSLSVAAAAAAPVASLPPATLPVGCRAALRPRASRRSTSVALLPSKGGKFYGLHKSALRRSSRARCSSEVNVETVAANAGDELDAEAQQMLEEYKNKSSSERQNIREPKLRMLLAGLNMDSSGDKMALLERLDSVIELKAEAGNGNGNGNGRKPEEITSRVQDARSRLNRLYEERQELERALRELSQVDSKAPDDLEALKALSIEKPAEPDVKATVEEPVEALEDPPAAVAAPPVEEPSDGEPRIEAIEDEIVVEEAAEAVEPVDAFAAELPGEAEVLELPVEAAVLELPDESTQEDLGDEPAAEVVVAQEEEREEVKEEVVVEAREQVVEEEAEAKIPGPNEAVVEEAKEPAKAPSASVDAAALIRRLKEENSKLQSLLETSGSDETEKPVEEAAPTKVVAQEPPPPPPEPKEPLTEEELYLKYNTHMTYTMPEEIKAGETFTVFFNRKMSPVMHDSPSVFITGAYNGWEYHGFNQQLFPTKYNVTAYEEWWSCELEAPEMAYQLNFVFTDNDARYENNNDMDFNFDMTGGPTKKEYKEWQHKLHLEEQARLAEERAREEAERARKEAIAKAEADKIAAEEKAKEDAERLATEKEEQLRQQRQDEEQAEHEVNDLRNWLRERARKSTMNHYCETSPVPKWYIDAEEATAGEKVKLYYNVTILGWQWANVLYMKVGRDGWNGDEEYISMTRFDEEPKSAGHPELPRDESNDWFVCEVEIPDDAYLLDFVFCTSTVPHEAQYDNNGGADYALKVEGGFGDSDERWDTMIKEKAEVIRVEREEREARDAAWDIERASRKQEMKKSAMQKYRESMRYIYYTEPETPKAGQPCTVYYSPEYTNLHGEKDIWIRGSFNRWRHPHPFQPVKLQKPTDPTKAKGGHLCATINVPADAWCLDFVFTDSADEYGATYDSRGGLDYNVPVEGPAQVEPLHIMHIAVEMAPVAKVGGLADVVTSLSKAVAEEGHTVEAVIPKYDCIDYNRVHWLTQKEGFPFENTYVNVFEGYVEGVKTNFLDIQNGSFNVGCVYGRKDDAARFHFFCHAALEFILKSGRQPHVIHCHDWSSAPVARLFWDNYHQTYMGGSRIVFTIHNLEYGADLIGQAMHASQKATTVSPTYAMEVSGHGAIEPNLGKFVGIRNGIDPDMWDPMNDSFLPMRFSPDNCVEGKAAAKKRLREWLNLRHDDRPLVACVSRLTHQKGIHLIKHAIYRVLDRGGQFVLLGSAPDDRIQGDFEALANEVSS